MNDSEHLLSIAASSHLPILLQGESGCGKEVAAQAIHQQSQRAHGPFIAINCGALSASLLESLLCGYVKGAFTGAHTHQKGYVLAADQGTLFLDEVGELPLEAQCRFLRILQEKKVCPLGSPQEIPVDFRLICATHRNLEEAVRLGRFRQDLFYRIAVLPIHLQPLRHRLDELDSIARNIWKNAHGPQSPTLTKAEIDLLKSKTWPGNIRQLRNVMERYALLKEHGHSLEQILATESWELSPPPHTSLSTPSVKMRTRTPDVSTITECLHWAGNNKSKAARRLGISRGSLCYHLRKQPHQSVATSALGQLNTSARE